MAFRVGAVLHGYLGQAEKAVDYAQRADRLNPLDSGWAGNMGYVIAYFGIGDHEKVLDWTARILREKPNVAPALRYRAASLALLGRVEEAHEVVARILKQTPGYTIEDVRRHHEFDMHSPFKVPGVTKSSVSRAAPRRAARMTEQRRLAAILVADVVGYSKLMGSDEAGRWLSSKHCARRSSSPRSPSTAGGCSSQWATAS